MEIFCWFTALIADKTVQPEQDTHTIHFLSLLPQLSSSFPIVLCFHILLHTLFIDLLPTNPQYNYQFHLRAHHLCKNMPTSHANGPDPPTTFDKSIKRTSFVSLVSFVLKSTYLNMPFFCFSRHFWVSWASFSLQTIPRWFVRSHFHRLSETVRVGYAGRRPH